MPSPRSSNATMQALVIARPGSSDALEIRDVPRPAPRAGEVLVRVHAAGLNRADLLQRGGRYPAPPGVPADIPGLEFAGTVEAGGDGASRWPAGTRVFGLVAGGAQAEFLTVHEDAIAELPPSLDFATAAAVPEAFITAHDAMVAQAGLHQGERILVFAVASGVGLAAVHLARALGAEPYGTTRSAEKLAAVRAEGLADGAAIATPDELPAHVDRWTDGRGMDVVLDLVGGDWMPAGLQSLAPHGRLMCIGTLAGARATVDLRRILSRRLTIRGTVLRARPLEEKIAVTRAFARDVIPLLAAGTVRPVIEAVMPLARAGDAYQRLEENATVGKLVLTMD